MKNKSLEINKKLQVEITKRKWTEEKLSVAYDALDSSVNGVIITDLEGKINYTNAAFLNMFEYTDFAQVEGNQASKLFPSKKVQKFSDVEAIIGKSKGETEDFLARHKDGTEFHVEVSSTVVTDKVGNNMGRMASFVDITERKQAEEKLNKTNRLYATLSQINQTVVRAPDKQSLFQKVCNIAIEFGKFKFAWIGLVNEKNKSFDPVAFSGDGSDYLQNVKITLSDDLTKKGPTGRSIREGKSIVFNDLENNPDFAPWRKQAVAKGYRSSAAFPIRSNNSVIGALNVYSVETNFFNESEIKLLEEAAIDISFALEKFSEEKKRKQAEEEIHQAAAYTRNLIEASLDPLVTIGPDGKITDVNKATENATGKTRKELIGSNFSSYFNEPLKAKEGYEQVFKKGIVKDYPLEIKHKNGSITSVLYNASVYKDASGKVIGIFAAARDITKLKQVVEKLNKTNRLYATLSQINQALVREQDKQTLFQKVCNIAIEFGKFKFAWIGLVNEKNKSVDPVAFSGDGSDYLQNVKITLSDDLTKKGPTGRSIREGKSIVFNDLENNPDFAPWRKQAVAKGYRSSAAFPIRLNKSVIGALNIYSIETHFFNESEIKLLEEAATDISFALEKFSEEEKRKQAEEEIKESAEKFRSLVNNSPDVIMRIDSEGVINYINYEYSNQKPEDILGQTIYKFMPSEFHEVARSTIKKVFETGESVSFENIGIGMDEVLWYKNNIAAIRKNGKIVAATVIATNISKQKQAEIMQSEFIASISHELRTPLTTIRESLSLLSDKVFGELNSDQLDIVNPCLEDVDRLGRIINNLLDISRMEVKRIKLERKMEDIVKLAQGVLSSFGHQAASKNIELVFTPSSKSINLYLDSNRIIQVFMNLIGNAIKFTEKGKIEVLITERKHKVECCIADTGRGIAEKDLGTLFDRLHQVGKLMRTGEKGSGLGLSICKGIVKLHKGKIWVNSTINKGSKFYFSLPKYSTDEIIIENIENEIKKFAGKHIKRSLLLVRLNNYSDIESKFGVDKASDVTKLIHQIIQDTLASGEFSFIKEKNEVILFSDITEQNIAILFSKLKDMLTRSVLKINKDLTIDLSYGCSVYPDNGDNTNELIQHASKELLK